MRKATISRCALPRPRPFLDDPGAGTGVGQGTYPGSITIFEVVAGYYFDAKTVAHDFVRTPDGTLTTFDPVGCIGTFMGNINNFGVIAGAYVDANSVNHGFVRTPTARSLRLTLQEEQWAAPLAPTRRLSTIWD